MYQLLSASLAFTVLHSADEPQPVQHYETKQLQRMAIHHALDEVAASYAFMTYSSLIHLKADVSSTEA